MWAHFFLLSLLASAAVTDASRRGVSPSRGSSSNALRRRPPPPPPPPPQEMTEDAPPPPALDVNTREMAHIRKAVAEELSRKLEKGDSCTGACARHARELARELGWLGIKSAMVSGAWVMLTGGYAGEGEILPLCMGNACILAAHRLGVFDVINRVALGAACACVPCNGICTRPLQLVIPLASSLMAGSCMLVFCASGPPDHID